MATAVPALPSTEDADVDAEPVSDEEDDSDNGSEEFLPRGPVDPERCTASGPGCQGGAAKAPVSVRITTVDDSDRRVCEGGAYVVVKVVPGPSAAAAGAQELNVPATDNNDGTYTATYSVPARGDYELIIEVNGTPIGGSPFPVFFSPPEPAASTTATTNGTSGAELSVPAASTSFTTVLPAFSMGAQAHAAGVAFPSEEEVLHRTLLIGNLSPQVNADQLKEFFGFCGTVKSCRLVGNQQQFAFVEYASSGEANAALAMNNFKVVDRHIAVELAKEAREASPQGMSNPFAALQLQQLTQLQFVQQQQKQLAEQVATLRVAAKTNPLVKNTPANSASQKAAALAAAAALKKRMAVIPVPERSSSPSTPRSRSPTRSRKPRSRSRSRRRSRSRSRRRSRSRDRRDRSRDRWDRERRDRDRPRDHRDRSWDRPKSYGYARQRNRYSDRDRDRNGDRNRDRDRERDRERERHREERGRDRDADRGRDRGRDKDRDKEEEKEQVKEKRDREQDRKDKEQDRKDKEQDKRDKEEDKQRSDHKESVTHEDGEPKKTEKKDKEKKSKSHKEKHKKSRTKDVDEDGRDRKRSKVAK